MKACKRRKGNQLDKHHLRCRSNGGDNSRENLSYVKHNQHVAWHIVFENFLPPVICKLINRNWLDGRYKFICVKAENYQEAKRAIKHLME